MSNGKPAVIPEWRQVPSLGEPQRSVTMLRPICRICERMDNRPWDWFKNCEHDPYVTMAEVPTPPSYEDVLDEKGEPTGRKRRVTHDDIVSYRPVPNAVDVAFTMRVNSGLGIEKNRRKGFILPSELKSPLYPNGIADTCQYRGCRKQTDLKEYDLAEDSASPKGTFCREIEAQMVWHDDNGTNHVIGEHKRVRGLRAKQLAEASV